MRCRRARRLIYEPSHGRAADRRFLEEHLARCAQCRTESVRLERLDATMRAELRFEPDEPALESVSEAALARIAALPDKRVRGVPMWPRLAAALAVACAVFASGVSVGRGLFPREIVTTRVVVEPRIEERVVEAPREIIRERVVDRIVPVVRERVVYRQAPRESGPGGGPRPAEERAPVKLAEVAVPVRTVSWVWRTPVIRSTSPVAVAGEAPPEAPGQRASASTGSASPAAGTAPVSQAVDVALLR